jgi:hypothetical protein
MPVTCLNRPNTGKEDDDDDDDDDGDDDTIFYSYIRLWIYNLQIRACYCHHLQFV